MKSGRSSNDRSSRRYSRESRSFLERQNTALEDELFIKVDRLKGASLELSGILQSDKSNVEKFTDLFDNAGDMMREVGKKFNVMKRTGGMNTLLYLSCFMVFVFILFYIFFF